MNLFDPERPKMGTRPMVIGQQFVVPDIMLHPNADGSVTLSVMLPSAQGGFSWHHCTLPVAEVGSFIKAYADAPELIFQADFHWLKVTAQIIDPHYTTQEERDEHYRNWPLPGQKSRPTTSTKTTAPPAGHVILDPNTVEF